MAYVTPSCLQKVLTCSSPEFLRNISDLLHGTDLAPTSLDGRHHHLRLQPTKRPQQIYVEFCTSHAGAFSPTFGGTNGHVTDAMSRTKQHHPKMCMSQKACLPYNHSSLEQSLPYLEASPGQTQGPGFTCSTACETKFASSLPF